MPGTCVVLNGASSSGKTSIAHALQARWRGAMQVSGVDTFLGCQAATFFDFDPEAGGVAVGFAWTPTEIDGVPALTITPGPGGRALQRAAQRFWRACADEGIDQVVDDVWLVREQAEDFKALMAGVDVLWVGVHCSLAVLEERERARGDRNVGQARGHAHLVHTWTGYDLEVDTSVLTADECATAILAALAERAG